MELLGREQFERHISEFDRCVAQTPEVDLFCSSSDWILPAADALMPGRTPWVLRGRHGWGALMRGLHPRGFQYAEPFEALWGMACPLLGPDPAALAEEFAAECRQREDDWDVLVLAGIPRHSELHARLAGALSARYAVRPGGQMGHCVASLAGGVDGFLGRRSRNFRRNLGKAARAAAQAGIELQRCHDQAPDQVYDRILAVEAASWKGHQGVGIDRGRMREFYRLITTRLAARAAQRVYFARHEDRDVGYVLGGVFGPTYRGLQFSYAADYERASLGNLLQLRQIEELCGEGYAEYDLGMEMPYKHRWAEETRYATVLLVVKR